MHSCARAISLTNACMRLYENQRVFGCGKDEGRVKEAIPGLVEVFMRRIFSSSRDWTANEEICNASWVILVEARGTHARKNKDVWTTSIGFSPGQSSPEHVLYPLLYSWHSFFPNWHHISPYSWSAFCQSCSFDIDIEALLELECGVVGVQMIPSTVEYSNAGLRVFDTCTLMKGRTIRVYHALPICTSLSRQLMFLNVWWKLYGRCDKHSKPMIHSDSQLDNWSPWLWKFLQDSEGHSLHDGLH